MTGLRNLYRASVGKTGMQARLFVSLSLVTLLMVTMLVACGDADSPTATAAATLAPATATASTAAPPLTSSAPSAAPSLPGAISSARPSSSAQPSTGGSTAPANPSAAPSSAPSTGAVAAAGDGSCPATHPVKAGQVGPVKSYAVSGDTSFDRMRATECFATPAEAETAGYRKSTR
jgi:hypothetical protein